MTSTPLTLKDGRVITWDDLPEDNADLADWDVDYPALPDARTRQAAEFEPDLVDYIRREGEAIDRDRLRFLRSALLNGREYWIWEFHTPEGDKCYATVSVHGDTVNLCYDQDWHGLTPEQFMLADYFGCL